MDDYFCKTEIKIEKENEGTNQQFTNALVTELKPMYDKTTIIGNANKLNQTEEELKIEISETDDYYYKSIVKIEENKEQQKMIDLNAYEVTEEKFKVEIKDETDHYNSGSKNTIDEKNENIKEHLTEALVIKPSPTCFEKSYNSYETVQNDLYKTFEGTSYNVGETCNERIVKVEMDLLDGHYVESLIEIDENVLLDGQTTNYDLDEIKPYFVCDICKKSFTTKKRVARHIRHLHSAKSKTEKSTRKNNFIVNHTTVGVAEGYTENIRRPFICDVCTISFSQKAHFDLHKRVHIVEKPHKCNLCPKSFSFKSDLVKHKRVHTGEKPYKCNFCMKPFSQKCTLTQHERVHTGEKPFKCNVCLKSFPQKFTLTQHERGHTGEKPFKCNACLKSFTRKASLTLHERGHTGEKPHKCNLCPKSFSFKSDLVKHKRVHTGEKPYKCNFCMKSFSQKCTLTQHERGHTGEKPFKCNVCLKSFTRKISLTLHERGHIEEKPYKCFVCLKSFSEEGALIRHKRRSHRREAL